MFDSGRSMTRGACGIPREEQGRYLGAAPMASIGKCLGIQYCSGRAGEAGQLSRLIGGSCSPWGPGCSSWVGTGLP